VIVDSSAVIAILLGEQDAPVFAAAIEDAEDAQKFAVSALEVSLVIGARKSSAGLRVWERFLKASDIRIVAFDADQLRIATNAWWVYGKGRHQAGLNLGDCCTYALAKSTGDALLYKGEDFRRTDLRDASSSRRGMPEL